MKGISCTKLQLPPEPLTSGLPPPDSRSLCPLSSTEFVEPPHEQNSWVRHCHQQNLQYLCDNGIFHSVWVAVWSADQTATHTEHTVARNK